jgi:hypothetical protein
LYSEGEAAKVLEAARTGIEKAIEQKNIEVRWVVIGFSFEISSHYIIEVLFDGPPELLEGVPRGKPRVTGNPTLYGWEDGKVAAKSRFRNPTYITEI